MIKRRPPPNGNGNGATPLDDDSPFAALTMDQRRFLASYCVSGRVCEARESTGIGFWSHDRWLKTDSKYKAAFRLAKQIASQNLEDEARRRAEQWMVRHKFHNGAMIYVPKLDENELPMLDENGQQIMVPYIEREYSDALLMMLLKGHFPRKYRERQDVKMRVSSQQRLAGITPDQARKELLDGLKKMAGLDEEDDEL
jgi:hypothetical protein